MTTNKTCIKCKVANSPHAVCDECVKKYAAIKLSPQGVAAVQAAMKANPDVSSWYLFHDGRVILEQEYQQQMTSRTAQLVAISRDGFPILVNRRFMNIMHLPAATTEDTT
jgi:hypothetical protein